MVAMESNPRRTRALTILGGAAAAATAAFVASRLGVAGTIVGAAVASVVASIGAEVYGRAADRSAAAVTILAQRSRAGAAADDGVSDEALRPAPEADHRPRDDDPAEPDVGAKDAGAFGSAAAERSRLANLRFSWRHVVWVALGVFVVVLTAITLVEVVLGKPISSLWGGDNSTGTSVGEVIRPGAAAPSPSTTAVPVPTSSAVPTTGPATPPATSPVPVPTPTVTVTVTVPAPAPTPAPSPGQAVAP